MVQISGKARVGLIYDNKQKLSEIALCSLALLLKQAVFLGLPTTAPASFLLGLSLMEKKILLWLYPGKFPLNCFCVWMDHMSIPVAQGSTGSFSSKGGKWIVIQTKPELGYQRWWTSAQVSRRQHIQPLSSSTEAHLQVSWLQHQAAMLSTFHWDH